MANHNIACKDSDFRNYILMYIVLIIKKIAYCILYIVFWFLEHIVSKRDIILMQTYNPQVYCDNTKYLFEYLSNNTDYDVFWITENF